MSGFGMALVGTCGFGALVRLGGWNLRALVSADGTRAWRPLAAQRGVTAILPAPVLSSIRGSIDLIPDLADNRRDALISRATGVLNATLPWR